MVTLIRSFSALKIESPGSDQSDGPGGGAFKAQPTRLRWNYCMDNQYCTAVLSTFSRMLTSLGW